ncbi:MAG: hypothetical protein A3A04_02480 [Candidatus Harrisonbacteria bacterium RIFCSPLOWO2_01_FULL_40_28]|uniref:DUF8128 domain-containing protein n=2 Tax=Candidatus Harrisoniibacteriota TaxID=1817905 RepID=A0A1G1ZVH2_9BACT|nr:MAG: hypothetical protein A3A04_02480 [Candidatus Harrisonbacteria bacterium RIFCSPLOWO2_01_FULL_40_28]OGY68728.1 MAG: hypothetical protein A2586_00905 [Candidatus Harrisonbacteria bacterium RIFOXYD1_FULL_40_9]
MEIISGILESILSVFKALWWIITPTFLVFVVWDLWLMYIKGAFIRGIKWKLLEVQVPKEVLRTPKAMEQIFAAVHSMLSSITKLRDKYWYGKVQLWTSFEIVGNAGGIRFYVRVPADFQRLIESAVYSQYPNAEITEAEDYVAMLPSIVPNQVYDVWGVDLFLAKDSGYPIRTYSYFEEKEEERRLDPIAALGEVMSTLKNDESAWIQVLIRPIDDSWKKKGEELINKLIGKKSIPKKTSWEKSSDSFWMFIKNLIFAPIQSPNWDAPEEQKPTPSNLSSLTSGQQDVIKAVDGKISKLGFEGAVRFVYIDRRDAFTRANIAAVMGFFKQFNTQNLNAFKPNGDTITSVNKGLFKKWKTADRKRKMFSAAMLRMIPRQVSVFNTEELATIYHYPASFVGAPQLRRIETKRGGPPPGLPTE